MKKIFIFLIFTQNLVGQQRQLTELLYSKQFPQLQKALQSNSISAKDKTLYGAFVMNAFNRPAESKKLAASVGNLKNDSLEYQLHRIEYDNFVKLSEYKSAYKASQRLEQQYSSFMTAEELQDQKDETAIWGFLQSQKPPQISKKAASALPLSKDLAGLWNIPVSVNNSNYQFVFDTGAGISVITESYAKLLGISVLPNAKVNIQGGINGINNISQLAIADEIHLGNVVVRNALFLVFPDSALTFGGGVYKINGIIGLPIIKELGEIKITSSEMQIPIQASNQAAEQNLALDLLLPILYMTHRGETLPYTFDTGAQSSMFSNNFYDKYQHEFSNLETDSTAVGGAGGTKEMAVVVAPELTFEIDQKTVRFTDAEISLDALPANKKYYYGNIGQDLLQQFDSVTLNFQNSTISFGNSIQSTERRE